MTSAPPSKRLAFVQACWHRDIVRQGHHAFVAATVRQGLNPEQMDFYEVLGSVTIPLHAALLAQTGTYAAIVAASFVVNEGM